ncbi:MAG: hypothetical protein AAGG75_23675 [Bacteroidota bacterium]
MKTSLKNQLFSHSNYTAYISKFILLLFFLGSSYTLSFAQDCPPPQAGCTTVASFTTVVEIPSYPNCPIAVNYDLRICQGEFQIFNISFLDDVFCGPLNMDIMEIFFGSDVTALEQEQFLAKLISEIETVIADRIFSSAVSAGPIALYKCEGGLTTFTASFYRGSCVSLCVVGGGGGPTFVPISCGTTCCVKRIEYCLDANDQTVTTTTVEQVVPGECFAFALPQCPPGSLFQSPCFELCETE